MTARTRPGLVVLSLLLLDACAAAGPAPPPEPDAVRPLPPEIAATRNRLEVLLLQNILPFWHPGTLDAEHGGYRLNHDPAGKWLGPSDKAIVTQARCLWFYARLMRSPYANPGHLAAARHGYRFLKDRMWDPEHGGFFWAVDAAGTTPTKPVKHLYGQAFGLYALSEYARVSNEAGAASLARELFRLLERKAHDGRYGGYREFFKRDWTPADAETPRVMGGPTPDTKLMNTHLHLMEALTTYVDLTRDPSARERLRELIAVQTSAVVRKSVGACTDKYEPDWTPMTGEAFDVVSYGHDIENVWLIVDACRAAGISPGPHRDLFRTLFDYALRHGYDTGSGGFYDLGPFNGPATRRGKIWWVQSEGLVAALYMTAMFGDAAYRDAYLGTLDWIAKRQADGRGGDWHEAVRPDETVRGRKAHAWKGPYHNGRAVLQCLAMLRRGGIR